MVGVVDVFHDEIQVALAGGVEVEDGDDAVATEAGQGLCFPLKSSHNSVFAKS